DVKPSEARSCRSPGDPCGDCDRPPLRAIIRATVEKTYSKVAHPHEHGRTSPMSCSAMRPTNTALGQRRRERCVDAETERPRSSRRVVSPSTKGETGAGLV